ncbi:MAG: hypothetical protein NT133_11990 [Alphaproteobacteria bacterium]|nr:hypothetical protein [Alphaproteobacteria bacterium]
MFVDGHSLWPYLLAASVLREVEKLCVGKARPVLWKFRFIIALLIRRKFGRIPDIRNDGAQKRYVDAALLLCRDKVKFHQMVADAEATLAAAVAAEGSGFDARNAHQDRKFVERLLNSLSESS